MSQRQYPEGSGTPMYEDWVSGVMKFFRRSDRSEFAAFDGTNRRTIIAGVPITVRKRIPIATVNAGGTVVGALAGYAYRLVDCCMIAIGGAVAAVTTIDILGTQATASVKLLTFAQANLTRSTPLYPGLTGVTVLADGASFVANDVNTAITINITGSAATTATNIDVLLTYVID